MLNIPRIPNWVIISIMVVLAFMGPLGWVIAIPLLIFVIKRRDDSPTKVHSQHHKSEMKALAPRIAKIKKAKTDGELVVASGKTIDVLFDAIGAPPGSLHDRISWAEDYLGEHLVPRARYVASARNGVVHEGKRLVNENTFRKNALFLIDKLAELKGELDSVSDRYEDRINALKSIRSDVDLTLAASALLEKLLSDMHCQGKGLNERTDELQQRFPPGNADLPATLFDDLRYVASQRNRVVHHEEKLTDKSLFLKRPTQVASTLLEYCSQKGWSFNGKTQPADAAV